MALSRKSWRGLISSRVDPMDTLVIKNPLERSRGGSSGAFLALGSDNRRWYVKPENNLQGGKVIVTDYVVGKLGLLIGAPVCEVAISKISEDIIGFEFVTGARLESGYAHASLAVANSIEAEELLHRDKDSNSQRQASIYALYDWCWGSDDQWLYVVTDDQMIFSHDHGWYFPGSFGKWTSNSLTICREQAHPCRYPPNGLNINAIEDAASSLEKIDRSALAGILNSVPASWPVTNKELESLGYFLEQRIGPVSERLRDLKRGA